MPVDTIGTVLAALVQLGPAPVVASDNTLGAFSPHQGRLYVAYVSRPAATGTPASISARAGA